MCDMFISRRMHPAQGTVMHARNYIVYSHIVRVPCMGGCKTVPDSGTVYAAACVCACRLGVRRGGVYSHAKLGCMMDGCVCVL